MRSTKLILSAALTLTGGMASAQQDSLQTFISEIGAALYKLTEMQLLVRNIHPFLEKLQPIAIVEGDDLFIFDADSSSGEYAFRKKEPVPFPISKGIRASFPLSSYGGKPSCVVSKEVFDDLGGYATIFHEFMHCNQALTSEFKLKDTLEIAQIAARNNDYSWEINHPFPYQDSVFVQNYSALLTGLENQDAEAVLLARGQLKRHLQRVDYEYMIWQEWKEGFARMIENKIREKAELERNDYGKDQPFSRPCFYHGGEKLILHLVEGESELFVDLEKLFERMMNYYE